MGLLECLRYFRVKVQAAQVEVNRIGQALFVTEASAANLDHFDPAIDAFCRTITDLQFDGIEYSPQVLANGFGPYVSS